MSALYRPYDLDQQHLFPPSLRDWLPEDHLVYFISDSVDELDLAEIEAGYRASGKGNLPYHPRLMLKLLVYGYANGVFSSRNIAKACETDIAFRFLAANDPPGPRTLARFRKQHLAAFETLFVQVVQIAQASGLASLGTLAVDGSKIRANASKRKAMSYQRMQQEEKRLRREIHALTNRASDRDAAEDVEFGPEFRGDELPAELARREDRLRVIKAAKKSLEARTREAAAPQVAQEQREAEAREERGEPPKPRKRTLALGDPKPTDQENFTDPDSRIMKTNDDFQQCYNAQIAVDGDLRLIVAADVTNCAADAISLLPMVDAARANTDAEPGMVLADAGYKSEQNFQGIEARDLTAYIPLGREHRKKAKPIGAALVASRRMEHRMTGRRAKQHYRKRKHLAEPPFGWIKHVLGFRHFFVRGLAAVQGEFNLVCAATNLRRMHQWIAWR